MKPKNLFAPLVLALALPLTGCFVTTSDPQPERVVVIEPTNPASTLTVRWTISGTTNPSECQKALAPTIEIRVFDIAGREIAAYEQACTTFATSITLNAGTYSASALLLGEVREPRTTEVAIAPFTLVGGDELITDVNFPADSFL